MAIFPTSISDLFRSAPAQQQQQQPTGATDPTKQGAPAGDTTVTGNTTVPSGATPTSDGSLPAAFPAPGKGNESPMAGYKELWNTAATVVTSKDLVPTITADPAAMLAAAQKIDFTRTMDPALITKAMSGDAASFAAVVNSAVQAGFAQAATAAVTITTKALEAQAQSFETKYAPDMLRRNSIDTMVHDTVPLSSNPAAAPIVKAIQTQLASVYPTASPHEIAQQTEKYLQEFATSAITGAGGEVRTKADLSQQQRGQPLRREETDWSSFFNEVA